MRKHLLKTITLILSCIVVFQAYTQRNNESPYSVFGDSTPVLDSYYSNSRNWSLVIFMADSTIAYMEFKDNVAVISDLNGNVLATHSVNPAVYACFSTIDPRADEMPWVSPYTYCYGDPINFVDFDGLRPSEYEAALMADCVYDQTNKDLLTKLEDTKWIVSSLSTDITMNLNNWIENGLQSMLFERTIDGKTEYAYVYAGTNSLEDFLEDIAQIIGLAPQYSTAIYNAKVLSNVLGDSELTFIGHSLGGGEAAAASMATGREAITFNPAAVSPLTRLFYNLGSASAVTNYRIAAPGNGRIKYGGCWISNLQNNLGMGAPGKTIRIPINHHNPYTAHGINNFVKYFERRR